MCGRAYSTFTDDELALRYENKKPVKLPELKPNYNMAPTHEVLIVRNRDEQLSFDFLRWGLIPSWAKEASIGYKMINARGETIAEKPSFRRAFKSRRCIIPLSGFIEWKRDGETKRPFKIFLKDEPIMSVAGIWESWRPAKDEEEVQTFSIITTAANDFMTKIHDRMPVILRRKDEDAWLDPANEDTASLSELLRPCPSSWLKADEISTLINSPKNNRKEVLEPVS